MSTSFTATYFDGRLARPVPVTVTASEHTWQIMGDRLDRTVPATAITVSDRLARVPRFVSLPDRAWLETHANDTIDALLAQQRRGGLAALIHRLETHARLATAATVLLAAIAGSTLYWGVPIAARQAAAAVPGNWEKRAGDAALANTTSFLHETKLSGTERAWAWRAVDRVLIPNQLAPVQLVFRQFGDIPNAFALPGRIIVVTDDLVRLVETEEQFAAVIAHELAHLEARHGLQSIFRNSLALLVVTGLTGDLSTLTGFAAALPITLLQNGYSRAFEREADAQALVYLDAAGIAPEHLARVLELLEAAAGGGSFAYLSTHPPTPERIELIRGSAKTPAP